MEKDDLVVEVEDDIDYVQDDSDFMNIIWMTIGKSSLYTLVHVCLYM